MKKIYKSLLIGLIGLLFVSTELFAQIPGIAIQGVLRDPQGRTVNNGFYSVKFTLYDAATGGTELWTETQSSLETRNGLFATKLGSVNQIQGLPFDAPYFLGISVEGRAELTPRMELTISPYALGIMGQDNKFPSVGDVEVKTNLTVQEGNVTVGQGDMTLSNGNFTLTAGEVVIADPSSGIRFSDGTLLNTAFGGTAANLANPNSVIVSADSDTNGTGNIELQIVIDSKMTVHNDGVVSLKNALKNDSGQFMSPDGTVMKVGHFNPADSTITQRMTIAADGTATFNGKVKANGTPTENNDLVPLSELNAVKSEVANLKDQLDSLASRIGSDSQGELLDSLLAGKTAAQMLAEGYTPKEVADVYGKGELFGLDYFGGKIFEIVGDVTYIMYPQKISTRWIDFSSACSQNFTTRDGFGYGAYNSADVFFGFSCTQTNTQTIYRQIQANAYNGFKDWYVPSIEEIKTAGNNLGSADLPNVFSSSNIYSSSFSYTDGSSSDGIKYLQWNSSNPSSSQTVVSSSRLDQTLSYPLVRKVFKAGQPIPFQTNQELTIDQANGGGSVLSGIPSSNSLIGTQMAGGTVFATAGGFAYIVTLSNIRFNSPTAWGIPFGNYGAFGTGYENGNIYYDSWVASAGEVEEVINNTDLIENAIQGNSGNTIYVYSSTLNSSGNVYSARYTRSYSVYSYAGISTVDTTDSNTSLVLFVKRKPLND